MQKKNTIIKIFIAILILSLAFTGCSKEVVYVSDNDFLLDTIVNIKIFHYKNQKIDEDIISDSFELIKDYENMLSIHIEGSDMDRLAKASGREPISVDPFTIEIIEKSIEYSELSGGLFDITSGPLIELWAIDPPNGHLPSKAELEDTLPLIGYKRISLFDNGSVTLEIKGMKANLGAIAKGAITDKVKEFLVENGVSSAIINTGGNVLLIGNKPDDQLFSIGIQDPNNLRGSYLLALSISDKAVVSSGDYERFFEVDGKIYHHILDPFTGYPADTNIKQVSIIAENSTDADALSTTVLLMGLKNGIDLIESTEGVEAVFITKDDNIYITDGLEGSYTVNEELMENYSIVESKEELF